MTILSARQVGKTFSVSMLALRTALYTSVATIVCISPSQRQSVELVRAVVSLYRGSQDTPPIITESVLKVEWENGSRILALPASSAYRAELPTRQSSAIRKKHSHVRPFPSGVRKSLSTERESAAAFATCSPRPESIITAFR